jgi:hypothetical protein
MLNAIRPEQIKAIHVLKGQAGLSDVEYRAHLQARFKVVSSKDLSESQAGALMDDLRGLGGKALPKGRASKDALPKTPRSAAKRASGKFAPVLQALWIAGYNLGIVDNPDDSALLAFVKRQCKVDHDRFLTDGAEAAKAIEGLKAWIAREAHFGGFATQKQADQQGVALKTLNKRVIVKAIARRLMTNGLPCFDVDNFACLENFPRLADCGDADLDRLAAKMGAMLRERLGKKLELKG